MTQVRSMTQLPNTELRSYHSFTKGLYGLEIDCTEHNIGGWGKLGVRSGSQILTQAN